MRHCPGGVNKDNDFFTNVSRSVSGVNRPSRLSIVSISCNHWAFVTQYSNAYTFKQRYRWGWPSSPRPIDNIIWKMDILKYNTLVSSRRFSYKSWLSAAARVIKGVKLESLLLDAARSSRCHIYIHVQRVHVKVPTLWQSIAVLNGHPRITEITADWALLGGNAIVSSAPLEAEIHLTVPCYLSDSSIRCNTDIPIRQRNIRITILV